MPTGTRHQMGSDRGPACTEQSNSVGPVRVHDGGYRRTFEFNAQHGCRDPFTPRSTDPPRRLGAHAHNLAARRLRFSFTQPSIAER